MNRFRKPFLASCLLLSLVLPLFRPTYQGLTQSSIPLPTWQHLSTTLNDLEKPSLSTDQTAALVLDVDRDQRNDFIIASRGEPGPSLVWYKQNVSGWIRYVIDDTVLPIEAGGDYYDIDGDGDLDIVMGGDFSSNQVWWWENPYPTYTPNVNWTRRLIKNSGANNHHDQMFADVDNDSVMELVFWNQLGKALIVAEIPQDPRTTEPWPQTTIYQWVDDADHEGLTQGDIDGDGMVDIVGAGLWFKRNPNGTYTANNIDSSKRYSRSAIAQLKLGGPPEVLFVCGDCIGPMDWYELVDGSWIAHRLLDVNVEYGHSLDIADINGDGFLDIFIAEMRLDSGNPDAANRILYGDGAGNFITTIISNGIGNHESKLADLDADGDLDILGKPFNWDTPRLDIWINEGISALDSWERDVIDAAKPWRAVFIIAADINGDSYDDLVAGGWWYQNPGAGGGDWVRHTIGAPLNNMAVVYDFDGDGDIDVLGTQGEGSDTNSDFAWGRNNGNGDFTIFTNIESGEGPFLQGAVVDRFQGPIEVALSWNDRVGGLQMLTVPDAPETATWTWRQANPLTLGEGLYVADIDEDGDKDISLGTAWLRNEGTTWTAFTIYEPDTGETDRVKMVDMDQDGDLDAVIGYGHDSVGKLAWYEQTTAPTDLWTQHLIANLVNPQSVDVADMDGDGDLDVVVGEHNLNAPDDSQLLIYENVDGKGGNWGTHLVYRGDEHHVGAQTADLDKDGDLDIFSIGWLHDRVMLYENATTVVPKITPTPTPTETATPTPTQTVDPGGQAKELIYLPLVAK